MEQEGKFLSLTYLQTRLQDFEQIRHGDFVAIVKPSNRAMSKSVYIEFYGDREGRPYKCYTLRISDHRLEDCAHIQFIVDPFAPLTKTKKKNFVRTINGILAKCEKKMLSAKLYFLEKGEL